MTTLQTYARLSLAGLKAQMQYKLNFASFILNMIIAYTGQFIGLRWLTYRFPALAGWQLEDIVMLHALGILAWGMVISFFFHLHNFEDEVRQGGYDRYLIRPLNPFWQAVAKQSPLGGAGQLIFSITAFIWASHTAGVQWTAAKLTYLVLTTLGGALILSGAVVAVGALSFWTTRSNTFYWALVFPARNLSYYPMGIYAPALQAVLTFVVPFAFITYYPAHYLLNKAETLFHPALPYLTPVVGLLAFTGAYWLWMKGTSRYTGTGS